MNFGSDFAAQSQVSDGDLLEDPTGRYVRFNEILGKGAFKTVYKAFDKVEGIEVAWSQVNIEDACKSAERIQSIYAEIHLLKSMQHDNIIKFYNSWVDDRDKTINLVTELFTSGNLRLYRKKHKNVDMKAIKNWARQILQGLVYLHGHNPPIIHRDIKCDNIFINGNCGEVKIGDLGLAVVMQQPFTQRVAGTPEFMAPEVYDQKYNELVDIYSFGMCVLEMVTCEYPYDECINPAHIYKKVTSGIKPASLNKLSDPQVKQFIEKCIVPASLRLSAAELLKDPFLITDNSKELASNLSINLPHLELTSDLSDMDYHSNEVSVELCSKGIEDNPKVHDLDNKDRFKLTGKKNEDNSISFYLCMADPNDPPRHVHFPFYLDTDTPSSVAEEMAESLELSLDDVASITELIVNLITDLVPCWKSPSESTIYENFFSSEIIMGNDAGDDNNHLWSINNNSERCYMSSSSYGFNSGDSDHLYFENKSSGSLGDFCLMSESLKNCTISCIVTSCCKNKSFPGIMTTYGR